MPRSMTSAASTEITSMFVRPFFLVSCQFADQTYYLWTGVGDLVWNGQTWKGVGTLGNISAIAETTTVEAQGIALGLSGIPSDLLNESMSEMQAGGIAQVYLGFLDPSGNVIADPIPAYIGLLDEPAIDVDTGTTTLTFAVENRLSDLNRSRGGRYTDQDQRSRYPNDGSLRWVQYLQDQHFNWK